MLQVKNDIAITFDSISTALSLEETSVSPNTKA